MSWRLDKLHAAHTPEPLYAQTPVPKHLQKDSKVTPVSAHHWQLMSLYV